jgi:hypothetical protein
LFSIRRRRCWWRAMRRKSRPMSRVSIP